jgi:heme/copper-type cytochrome/quinol oxidase subunit 2
MTPLLTAAIAHLMSFVAAKWQQLQETEDAGEIDEKVIIIALMSAATIGIIATVIIVALNSRAEEGAGYLQ